MRAKRKERGRERKKVRERDTHTERERQTHTERGRERHTQREIEGLHTIVNVFDSLFKYEFHHLFDIHRGECILHQN